MKQERNYIYPIILCVVLLVGLCIIFNYSYALWMKPIPEKYEEKSSLLQISLTDGGKGVTLDEMRPMVDVDGISIDSYRFSVKNIGDVKGKYRILIEELPLNELEDGCTKDKLLDRSQLRYQLLMNGKELALNSLDYVNDDILAEVEISKRASQDFQLRVWLKDDEDQTAWENKHYHYRIKVTPVTES